MAILIFKQGEDIKLSVEVTETPAIDFNTATAIKAILKVGGVEQKKYSLSPITPYATLEVDGVADNKVNIFVEREDSSLFPTGVVTIDLVAAFPDITFPDGNKVREFNFTVAKVQTGSAKDEVIP